MTAKQILDSFSETLMEDERILTAQERILLSSILRNVKATPNANRDTCGAVNAVLASAVGETVAQRAFAVLGGSIVERIIAAGTDLAEDATIYPTPRTSLGPQPPMKGPQPPMKDTPAGPQPPMKGPQPPMKDTPAGPQPPMKTLQPPGHGLRPEHVQMNARVDSGTQLQAGVLDRPEVLPAQCVVLDEFLAPQELEELTAYVLQHESAFTTSEVLSPAGGIVDYQHRRSHVLMDTGPYENIIAGRIKNVLPLVLKKLGMEQFPIAWVETQLTASNDGDFFGVHEDNGEKSIASRNLTFVYFFQREPQKFEGGDLRIHDSRLVEDRYLSAGSYYTVVPRQNQIVFFPCRLLHEITPVRCPSRAFADSRFTLNGWLHR